MIFTGAEIVETLCELEISHVIWIPDTVIGSWEGDLEEASFNLIRICREGEAWPLAAGLLLGGAAPIVMMQTTGLFESGDALRNVAWDLQAPVFGIIGARNWLNAESADSAKRFAKPIVDAWDIDCRLIASRDDRSQLTSHYLHCKNAQKPGFILLAE